MLRGKHWCIPVIFSFLAFGCGPLSTAPRAQGTTEFTDSNVATGLEILIQAEGLQSGVLTCDTRTNLGLSDNLKSQVVEINGSVQPVETQLCSGDSKVHYNLPAVSLEFNREEPEVADTLEIENQTTCTRLSRSFRDDPLAMHVPELQSYLSINQLETVPVLSPGLPLMEAPSSLSLDPLRPNILMLRWSVCLSRPPGRKEECIKSKVLERKIVVLRLKFGKVKQLAPIQEQEADCTR